MEIKLHRFLATNHSPNTILLGRDGFRCSHKFDDYCAGAFGARQRLDRSP